MPSPCGSGSPAASWMLSSVAPVFASILTMRGSSVPSTIHIAPLSHARPCGRCIWKRVRDNRLKRLGVHLHKRPQAGRDHPQRAVDIFDAGRAAAAERNRVTLHDSAVHAALQNLMAAVVDLDRPIELRRAVRREPQVAAADGQAAAVVALGLKRFQHLATDVHQDDPIGHLLADPEPVL